MAALTGLMVLLYAVTFVIGNNIIDLTCYAPMPTVDRRGDDDVIIAGYKSGADTDIDVEFGRESFTGTGNGLPSGYVEEDHPSGNNVAELLRLPGSAGLERIGTFYCQATKYGITAKIVTTILATSTDSRYVTPNQISITANVGENVILSVIPASHVVTSDLRWRHNNGEEVWFRETSHIINNVTVGDTGVYECYTTELDIVFYRNGNHAIMQLIVRACPAERWGPPTCNNICPHCYNGGVCDDRSGLCVCPPGFSGSECHFVHGSNRWGQDGQRVCSRSNGNDPHSTACRGALFCLPHPYGCTCAAGYYGINCDQECQEGTYGANCRSECHCADGVYCQPDTGECSDGQCQPDWYGVNCQVPCPVPGPVSHLLATSPSSTELLLAWHPSSENSCVEAGYTVQFSLLNKDQCEVFDSSQAIWANADPAFVSSLTRTLNALLPYSTYNVSVRTQNTAGVSEGVYVVQTTNITKPSAPPSDIIIGEVTPDTFVVYLARPFCGARHGEIVSYSFILTTTNSTVVMHGSTSSPELMIANLSPFTTYNLQVAAVTNAGEGPLSESLSITTSQAGQNGTAQIATVILVILLCISAISNVAMTYYILRSKNKQLKQDPTPATMAAPPPTTTSNPGSDERIQMSLDGYVEYKPDQPESTYQGTKENVQGDDTYAEIPVSINTTNLVSPDNIDGGDYTNDSVIRQPRWSKQPQKKPDQAGIYEVSM